VDGIAGAITDFFNAGNADLGKFLASLTLIGTATMALIQAVKDTTPLKQAFQRHRLRKWIREGIDEAEQQHGELLTSRGARIHSEEIPSSPDKLAPDKRIDVDDVEQDIVHLAVDGDQKALYDLAIEQLCGQLNAAMQMVIDYPNRHLPLLLVAASAASTGDLESILGRTRSQFDQAGAIAETPQTKITYADSRNRVSHQIQRSIDGFQIAAAFRWKWLLQLASFAISALLAAVALAVGRGSLTGGPWVITILGTAVLAGFLAPVARDLTAALQKLRT
jgi:hypothetical protein